MMPRNYIGVHNRVLPHACLIGTPPLSSGAPAWCSHGYCGAAVEAFIAFCSTRLSDSLRKSNILCL